MISSYHFNLVCDLIKFLNNLIEFWSSSANHCRKVKVNDGLWRVFTTEITRFQLLHKLSNGPCVEGEHVIVTKDVVDVKRECQAVFLLCTKDKVTKAPTEPPTEPPTEEPLVTTEETTEEVTQPPTTKPTTTKAPKPGDI